MIIFDFDGTLADSIGLGFDLVNSHAERLGYTQVPRERGMELSALEIMKEAHISFFKLPRLVIFFKKLLAENSDKIKMIDGADQLLAKLKAEGHKLGILTTNSADCVSDFLKKNNLKDYFTYIRTDVAMFGKIKALKKAKKQLKTDFIYVGDELRDVEACKFLGIPIVSVPYGFNSARVLEKKNPGLVAANYEEAYKLISSLVKDL